MRQELLESAVSFLSSPNIKTADREKKIQFLEKKGLTKEEIEEAFKKTDNVVTPSDAEVKTTLVLIEFNIWILETQRTNKATISSCLLFYRGNTNSNDNSTVNEMCSYCRTKFCGNCVYSAESCQSKAKDISPKTLIFFF